MEQKAMKTAKFTVWEPRRGRKPMAKGEMAVRMQGPRTTSEK
jgi:hypothetical protein